jgi:diguanylate cyclase (GGDEF)-like protein/PAS domain S-box-containing protein
MRDIDDSGDRSGLFRGLLDVLESVIDFEEAFLLQEQERGKLIPLVSTTERFQGTVWQPHSVFQRVFRGRPVAVFDVAQVQEWAEQPVHVREKVSSALHIGLHGDGPGPLLVVTHRRPRHFGPLHVQKAARFASLAAQALATMEARETVMQRHRFFQLSVDLMGIVNSRGQLQQFNGAWSQVLGYREKDLKQNPRILDYVHPEDREDLSEALQKSRHTGEPMMIESRLRCHDGTLLWFSLSLVSCPGERLSYIVARDITERVLAERQLAFQATHDCMTGLYNRIVFTDHLERAIAQKARAPQYHYAVLYLDLDRFKSVNDTLGHSMGDELLREIAGRLRDTVRKVDTVARLGGDEFVILAVNLDHPESVEKVAGRLEANLRVPLSLHGNEVTTSASIGIAVGTGEYQSADEVLRDADIAMYEAKARGRGQFVIFVPEMRRM